MKIVLINPPHTAIGSRIPDDHLPPLGLLSVAGPLIDDGHDVGLIDAEFGPLTIAEITDRITANGPDLVLIGHSGSTSAHPTARAIAEAVKRCDPSIRIVYGGVFPTYHWREVLAETEAFDIVVRGEGEETMRRLADALAANRPLNPLPASPIATATAKSRQPNRRRRSPISMPIASAGN